MLGDLGGGVTEFIYSEEGAGVSPFLVRKEKFLSLSAPLNFPHYSNLIPKQNRKLDTRPDTDYCFVKVKSEGVSSLLLLL